MLCENRQESGSVCLSTAKFQSRRIQHARVQHRVPDESQNDPAYLFGPYVYSSFLPPPICVLLFFVHANLCTAIQIYFHDCQVKFKFMSVLLFMSVSQARKHFAYVISGNFVACTINSAITSDTKIFLTLVICKKWNFHIKNL